jgi:hypothetical protein
VSQILKVAVRFGWKTGAIWRHCYHYYHCSVELVVLAQLEVVIPIAAAAVAAADVASSEEEELESTKRPIGAMPSALECSW